MDTPTVGGAPWQQLSKYPPSQPYGFVAVAVAGGLPDLRRAEMRAVGVRVTDALHDGHVARRRRVP